MIYKCSKCGKEFTDPKVCSTHERKDHIPPEAIICPICNGTGWVDGTDGCDCFVCYTCDGIGKVIPKTHTQTVYEKI
jgi:DNA-directed RNA polymerase subunit RPC12/RpoP